ncbi:MAG: prolyl oligopeptidase family serine peptidase [Gemmatimonadaceae bacterium]
MLLTTGLNDGRVDSWQSAKMAARLLAATSSGRPVLLRVEREGGHAGAVSRSSVVAEFADESAFLLWQLGHPSFQPRRTATAP